MAAGRPEIFSNEFADIICEQIATTSKSLRTICLDEKLPCVSTVLKWLNTNEQFLAQYTRAKENQADFLAEEMISIADNDEDDEKPFVGANHIQRDRLKVETRKWAASKLKPKKYGDRVDLTTNGKELPAANIINLPTESLKQLEQIIANAATADNERDITTDPQGTIPS